MKRNSISLIMAAGLMTVGTAALAQNKDTPVKIMPTETITVVAPYIIYERQVTAANPAANPHVKLMDVSMLGSAGFGDLDLSKPQDTATLKTRIHDEAKSLCKRLETQYPQAVYVPVTNQDCVKAATDDAMVAANILIEAYHHI
jgi:UrcA family protein